MRLVKFKRRKNYLQEYRTNSYSHNPETNPLASRTVCGTCNKVFFRKGWRSSNGYDRKVWQCSERYRVKGVQGCDNRYVEKEMLVKAYLMAWNALVENRRVSWNNGNSKCGEKTCWWDTGQRDLWNTQKMQSH